MKKLGLLVTKTNTLLDYKIDLFWLHLSSQSEVNADP